MEKQQWGVWIFRTVLLMIAIGAWFAQMVWHGQERIAERLNAMDVNAAAFSANRFTASDWVAAKGILDAQMNARDIRIFKLEGSFEQITKSLDRLESRLGTSKDK